MELDYLEQQQKEILTALQVLIEEKKSDKKSFVKKWGEELIIALSILLAVGLFSAIFAFHDMQKSVETFEKDYVKKEVLDALNQKTKTFRDDANYNFKILGAQHNIELKTIKE